MADYERAFPNTFDSDFVAAAVQLNDEGIAFHAGIIIKTKGSFKIFHFNHTGVHFDDILEEEEWYFLKRFSIINPRLTLSFYNYCLKVWRDPRPQYGMLFDGSFYNEEGEYYSQNGLPNYTSCVGFCLNVIKGTLFGEDLVHFPDWDGQINMDGRQAYIENFIAKVLEAHPDIKEEVLRSNIRRVLPIEYFASAYFDHSPVRKTSIDQILTNIQQELFLEVA